jgi:hypothetical protein
MQIKEVGSIGQVWRKSSEIWFGVDVVQKGVKFPDVVA